MCWCLDRTVLLLSPIVLNTGTGKYDILYTLTQSHPQPPHWKIKLLHPPPRPTTGNLIIDKVATDLRPSSFMEFRHTSQILFLLEDAICRIEAQ